MKGIKETAAKVLFTAAAGVSVLAVALICVFLFASGIPAIGEIGPIEFLTGTVWRPASDTYGILPMILGSVYATACALAIGVPVGLLCAVYLSRFASPRIKRFLVPGVELLAGIPSVVYGFFGLVVLVPLIRQTFTVQGMSLLAASIILGVMILPTIVTVARNALDAVPESYYEGALALGADHERSVFRVLVPAAGSGIMAGVVLGVGRAIGETMAVVMIAGNQVQIPNSLLDGVRTLTTNIVMEMGYAADLHREALIATAVVLFVFVLLINLAFAALNARSRK
ncbi:MAG: phosphate ABC transporter permease subunit PstC [Slackia sp.]|nr:phosphate ABC transporter permease subunit PstC [Slackia sp.]